MCWRVASEMREQRGMGRAGTARKGHGRSRAGPKRGELRGRGGAGRGDEGSSCVRTCRPDEGERSGQCRAGAGPERAARAGRESRWACGMRERRGRGGPGRVCAARGTIGGAGAGDGGYAVMCRRDARASGAGVAGSVRGGGGGVAQGSG